MPTLADLFREWGEKEALKCSEKEFGNVRLNMYKLAKKKVQKKAKKKKRRQRRRNSGLVKQAMIVSSAYQYKYDLADWMQKNIENMCNVIGVCKNYFKYTCPAVWTAQCKCK